MVVAAFNSALFWPVILLLLVIRIMLYFQHSDQSRGGRGGRKKRRLSRQAEQDRHEADMLSVFLVFAVGGWLYYHGGGWLLGICAAGLAVVGILLAWLFVGKKQKRAKPGVRSSAEARGYAGEDIVFDELQRVMEHDSRYRFWPNVYLPEKSSGETKEIDFLVVSPFGMFVIEVKNWTGTVYGLPNKQHWTTYSGGEKQERYNPLWQNRSKTRLLKEITKLPDSAVFSVVVFISASLRGAKIGDRKMNKNAPFSELGNNEVVVFDNKLHEYILSKHGHEILSEEELRQASQFFERAVVIMNTAAEKEAHIDRVQKHKKRAERRRAT